MRLRGRIIKIGDRQATNVLIALDRSLPNEQPGDALIATTVDLLPQYDHNISDALKALLPVARGAKERIK